MPPPGVDDEKVRRIRDAVQKMGDASVSKDQLAEEIVRRIRACLPASGALTVYLEVVGQDNLLSTAAAEIERSLANEPRLVLSRPATGASVPAPSPGGGYTEALSASGEPYPAPQVHVQLTAVPGQYECWGSWVGTPGITQALWHLTIR